MDYISSIFQLDQLSSDTLFQLPPLLGCDQKTLVEDLSVHCPEDHHDQNGCLDAITRSISSRRRRKASEAFGVDAQVSGGNNKEKKVMHRDIERKRRQEMASLYRSLRSHLPLEYLKGRRSISDHIHQTVNYIKHHKQKIKELSDKRDELKRLSKISSSSSDHQFDCSKFPGDTSFRVNSCLVGVEVVVDTTLSGGLPLSKVLQLLIKEGLIIVSCVSTSVNERMLHNVTCQESYGRSIGISELQQELIKELKCGFSNLDH